MDDQHISEILQRAQGIVANAELGDALQPVAFRVVAEALVEEARDRYAGLPVKGERLEGIAINEFLAALGARSHTDRFVAIAYYLLHSGDQLTFNITHVKETYTLAREPKPKNFAAIAGQCASRGFFTETGAKLDDLKEWQITKTGEAHVERLLDSAG